MPAVGVTVSQRRMKNARAGRLAEELSKSMTLTNPVPGRSTVTTAVVDNPVFKEALVAPAAGLDPQFAGPNIPLSRSRQYCTSL